MRAASEGLENSDSRVRVVLGIDDVSKKERSRQVMERKSRLDALGQLTGGIARDFNNLLAFQLFRAGQQDRYSGACWAGYKQQRQARGVQTETLASPETHATFRCIEISVTNIGLGMDDETLSRSIDLSFTTKSSGSGIGLGLAIVHGLVRQSDGGLRTYSEEGVGTTVQPTSPRGTELGARRADAGRQAAARWGRDHPDCRR